VVRKPSREREQICGLALVVEFQRRLVDIFMGADVKASGRRRSETRLIASGSGRMPPKIASSASMFWEASDHFKALKTELLSHTYKR